MLGSWPSTDKLREIARIPHAWLEETARGQEAGHPWVGVTGFEVPTVSGKLGVLASARGVVGVLFPGFDAWKVAGRIERHGLAWSSTGQRRAVEAGLELMGYLLGEVKAFSTPIDMSRLSPFLRDVYGALVEVPWGATVTYGELARLAGHPNGARAVGTAMRRNPIPIFVPCHRVVSSGTGGLGGWSGPVGWKEKLLALEGAKTNKPSLQIRRTR
jgi:methylated-DNA-[protein]-cysteine S-methyltransferase